MSEAAKVGKRGTVVIPAKIRRRQGAQRQLERFSEDFDMVVVVVVESANVVGLCPRSAQYAALTPNQKSLEAFGKRWRVGELSLFGSVLRDDFGPSSDFDILVSFEPEARPSLLGHVAMKEELAEILGRPVDLVTRRAVERSRNPIRRDAILSSSEVVYVGG